MAERVFVVEDDQPTRLLFESCLEANGYAVKSAKDGKEALHILKQEDFDVVLLDVMLEDTDGFTLCEQIRQFSHLPIIMVTAKDEPESIVKALNLGADDYIIKPFNTKELLARIAAVIRRASFREELPARPSLQVGDITVDYESRRVLVKDQEIRLTPTEYKLLVKLLANTEKVQTHSELLTSVWGPEYANDTHYLRVCIGRIRKKLNISEDNAGYIRTVPTVGYMAMG